MSKVEKKLAITIVGIADLESQMVVLNDPRLYHAFLLMSQNLEEATYKTDEDGFEVTPPLQFSFTDRLLVLRRPGLKPNNLKRVRDELLPSSDGIIINLAKRGLDPGYLATDAILPSLLRRLMTIIYRANRPVVVAVEDKPHSLSPTIKRLLHISSGIPVIYYSHASLKLATIQKILLDTIATIDNYHPFSESSHF